MQSAHTQRARLGKPLASGSAKPLVACASFALPTIQGNYKAAQGYSVLNRHHKGGTVTNGSSHQGKKLRGEGRHVFL